VRNGSDHRSTHGIDLGGGPSWSSRPSSLGGLPEFSPERLGRGRLRRLDIGGFPSGRRKGMGIWRLLIRVLGGLGLAWIMFGLMRIVASQVRMIYSRWVRPPCLPRPLSDSVTDTIVVICGYVSIFARARLNGRTDAHPS